MNRPLTRRRGPLVAATAGLLLAAAGAVLRLEPIPATTTR
jgi:hypothetical protein